MKFAHTIACGLLLAFHVTAIRVGSDESGLLRAPNVLDLEAQLLTMMGEQADPAATNSTDAENANLDRLAHGLAKLQSKGKATPEMMKFVDTVKLMIKDEMVPKILSAHKTNKATMKKLFDAFSKCKGKKTSADAVANRLRKSVTTFSTSQKTCRRQQQTHWRLKYDCTKLVAAKKKLMKADCDRQKLLMRDPNKEADNCHTTNSPEPYGIWLERNFRWFVAKDKVYGAAKVKCDKSRADYQREKPICDKKVANWKKKRGTCDSKQASLEGTSCTLATGLKKSCTEYRQCYRTAMKALSDKEPGIRKMVRDRKGEWRALKRIECLLGVFAEEDGQVSSSTLDACRKKTYSTKHLDIPFPRAPARQRCQALPATPCTSAFMLRHYKGLPKNSKNKACSVCVIKGRGFGTDPTYWLKAENFEQQYRAWGNDGRQADILNLVRSGQARLTLESGHGARSPIVAVSGSSRTVLGFGNIIPRYYTICSLTRYTSQNAHYRQRILNGWPKNWLHGNWAGRAGVVYYEGWKTSTSFLKPATNWVAVCGKNANTRPHNIMVNGRSVGRSNGGPAPPYLYVNAGRHGNEKSDFAIAEVMIWDQHLTNYHMQKAMSYLMGKLKEKISKTELARRKGIVNANAKPIYWLTPEKWNSATGGWANKGKGKDKIGNVVSRGRVRLSLEKGWGATQKVLAITGTTGTWLNFGNIIPSYFTMCSLSRYTSPHHSRRKRILMGAGVNWLHGHWMGRAGAVYYNGWKAGWSKSTVNPNRNWVALCATNDGHAPYNVNVNGRWTGVHQTGAKPHALTVNQGVWGNEKSDFAIAEVKIWDHALSKFQMQKEMNALLLKLNTKPSLKEEMRYNKLIKQSFDKNSKR